MGTSEAPKALQDDTPECAWESSYTRREMLRQTGAAAALLAGGVSLMRVASAGASVKKSVSVKASPKKNLLDGEVVFSDFVTLNREYYLQWHQGAKRAVEALGGTYKYAVDDQNAQVQVQHFEQQVKQGYKIFFNAAPDLVHARADRETGQGEQRILHSLLRDSSLGLPLRPEAKSFRVLCYFLYPELSRARRRGGH